MCLAKISYRWPARLSLITPVAPPPVPPRCVRLEISTFEPRPHRDPDSLSQSLSRSRRRCAGFRRRANPPGGHGFRTGQWERTECCPGGAGVEGKLLSVLRSSLRRARVLVLAGSLPALLPEDFYARAIRFARAAGVR